MAVNHSTEKSRVYVSVHRKKKPTKYNIILSVLRQQKRMDT
jgi:hypothetical protein